MRRLRHAATTVGMIPSKRAENAMKNESLLDLGKTRWPLRLFSEDHEATSVKTHQKEYGQPFNPVDALSPHCDLDCGTFLLPQSSVLSRSLRIAVLPEEAPHITRVNDLALEGDFAEQVVIDSEFKIGIDSADLDVDFTSPEAAFLAYRHGDVRGTRENRQVRLIIHQLAPFVDTYPIAIDHMDVLAPAQNLDGLFNGVWS